MSSSLHTYTMNKERDFATVKLARTSTQNNAAALATAHPQAPVSTIIQIINKYKQRCAIETQEASSNCPNRGIQTVAVMHAKRLVFRQLRAYASEPDHSKSPLDIISRS